MQCPNCKQELKEGYLYCETCGYEIQMVPDFKPEVDGSILSSLKDIQKEVSKETDKAKRILKDEKKGKVEIEYYSQDELDRIIDLIRTVQR